MNSIFQTVREWWAMRYSGGDFDIPLQPVPPQPDHNAELIAALRQALPIGSEFDHAGVRMTVIGHQRIKSGLCLADVESGAIYEPSLLCHYADASGQLCSVQFDGESVGALLAGHLGKNRAQP